MTTFKITVIVTMFLAIAYAPHPCDVPVSFQFAGTDTIVIFEDTCRPCFHHVYQQVMQQKDILQTGPSWANMVSTVTVDSIEQ